MTKKMIMERLYKFMSSNEQAKGREFHLSIYNVSSDDKFKKFKELTRDNVADEMAFYSFAYTITGMSCSYDYRWCDIYVSKSEDFSTNIDADVIDLLCRYLDGFFEYEDNKRDIVVG